MTISKSGTIWHWKKSGLIYDNYDELYEVYINTMECQHCESEFTKNNKRCLDHDHETGLFRKIICNRCNTCDSYIKYPFGFTEQDRKEQRKEYWQAYQQANKQKISERNKQKIQCECGSIVRRGDISTHRRSKKHSDYKLNNLV
jgi:hypothetical protein